MWSNMVDEVLLGGLASSFVPDPQSPPPPPSKPTSPLSQPLTPPTPPRNKRPQAPAELVLRAATPFNFCVIDEVDSILIDEARTPLIISGTSDQPRWVGAWRLGGGRRGWGVSAAPATSPGGAGGGLTRGPVFLLGGRALHPSSSAGPATSAGWGLGGGVLGPASMPPATNLDPVPAASQLPLTNPRLVTPPLPCVNLKPPPCTLPFTATITTIPQHHPPH
jgi:hypothetical protein